MANDVYRIIVGGKVDTTTVPGVKIMADYKEAPYYVMDSFGLTPLGVLNYVLSKYLTEEEEEEQDPPTGGETQSAVTYKTITVDVSPEFNDYSYDKTKEELDIVFELKAYVELIFTMCYDYCELIRDDSVDGIELSGDTTGFLFKSKYFNTQNKFSNYRTLMGLITERFISLKNQYFGWSYRQVTLNNIESSSYNFFIMPPR